MKAYKLFRKRRNGSLGPLFINRTLVILPNTWIQAECHPTKGFKIRSGWHCCPQPSAPHLSSKGRVWCEVEIKDVQEEIRPQSQGGRWYLAKQLKLVKEL